MRKTLIIATITIVILLLLAFVFFPRKSANTDIGSSSAQVNQIKLNTYTEQAGAYSFNYNPKFSVVNGNKAETTVDWRVNNLARTKGVILSTLTIPKSYMPSTNFSEAKFTIGRSGDPTAVENCMTAQNGETDAGTVTIGNNAFEKITLSDAGAGNFYDTTSYRAVLDGSCYVVEYTIHSTNIYNYDPSQGIKEFDKSKIQNDLESIIKSLTFQLAGD